MEQQLAEFKKNVALHWKYIQNVLETAGEHAAIIEKIGFHYRTAMEHGYKHALQDMNMENKGPDIKIKIPMTGMDIIKEIPNLEEKIGPFKWDEVEVSSIKSNI